MTVNNNILQKIIIDTDPGHDDALAIMLLAKSGLVDIQAITTVAGNSNIKNVTKNAAYVLDLLQRRDIPIYSGRSQPLGRKLVLAVVHGTSGLDGADTSHANYRLTGDADAQLVRIIEENPHKIILLAIGPLTNIARAFIKNPRLPKLLKKIIIMGGAINVCGNKNRVAEFNMFVDPEAADVVFRTDIPKVLIPLDVCNTMPLFLKNFEALKGAVLYKPIMSMMKRFIRGIEKYEGIQGALVYDAVAAYFLINPKAFKLEAMDIVIETQGKYTSGMTVAEKRISEKKMYNVGVVTYVDRDQFVSDFLTILKKQ